MAIPKNAIPTPKGWVHPKTGELLKSQKMTAAQIAEFYGTSEPAPAPEPVMQTLHEAPAVEREVTPEEVAHHHDDEEPVEEEKKSWRDIF